MALLDNIMGGLLGNRPQAPQPQPQQPQQPPAGALNMVRPSVSMGEDVKQQLAERLLGRYFGDDETEGSLDKLKRERDSALRKYTDQLRGLEPVSEAEKFLAIGRGLGQRVRRDGGSQLFQAALNVGTEFAPLAEKENRLKLEYKKTASQLLAEQAQKDYDTALKQSEDYAKILMQERLRKSLSGGGTLQEEIDALSRSTGIGPDDPRYKDLVRLAYVGLRGTPENKIGEIGGPNAIDLRTNKEYLSAKKDIETYFGSAEVRAAYGQGPDAEARWNADKQRKLKELDDRFSRLSGSQQIFSTLEPSPIKDPGFTKTEPSPIKDPGFTKTEPSPIKDPGFDKAVTDVLGREGGYAPKDGRSGAPANFGINQRANPDIDVKNLTRDQAKQIYKTRYWDAIGADKLDPAAQEVAFDAAVNQGQDYAKKLIEETGGDAQKMIEQRRRDYIKIVERNPAQVSEFKGWMNRLDDVAAKAGVKSPTGQVFDEVPLSMEKQPTAPATPAAAPTAPSAGKQEPFITPATEEKIKKTAEYEAKREYNMMGLGEVIDSARKIMATGKPVESGIGQVTRKVGEFFGISRESGEAAAALEAIGGALVSKMPRMEGPQSDFDVKNYQEMAAKVGDPTVPLNQRLTALKEVERLWRKYDKEAASYKTWTPSTSKTAPASATKSTKQQFQIIKSN